MIVTRILTFLQLLVGSIYVTSIDPAKHREAIPIWPEGKVPGQLPHDPKNGRGIRDDRDGGISLVHIPTITYFKYKSQTELSSVAIVLLPGGAYKKVLYEKEGVSVAEFLNRIGLNVFILKYRHAPYVHPIPLIDALQAIRFVRAHAALYGFSKHLIGVMGLSAGGHLAACSATLYDNPIGAVPPPTDTFKDIMATTARPDFVVLLHPVVAMGSEYAHALTKTNLLGPDQSEERVLQISPHKNVQKETPPMFILHTGEDVQVPSENSLLMYQALHHAKIHAELHIYAEGGHGLDMGMNISSAVLLPVNLEWPGQFERWLTRIQL
jgi:acetyl esterase/lipase